MLGAYTQTIENGNTEHVDLVLLKDKIVKMYKTATDLIIEQIRAASLDGELNEVPSKKGEKSKSSKLEDEAEEISSLMKEYGTYIQVWKNETEKETKIGLDVIIAYLQNGDKELNANMGFSIYNGLKISNMFVGSNMLKFWDHASDDLGRTHLRAVTTLMQTKDAIHFELSNYYKQVKNELKTRLDLLAQVEGEKKLNKENFYKNVALKLDNIYDSIDSVAVSSFTSKSKIKYFPVVDLYSKDNESKHEQLKKYIESVDSGKTVQSQWERDNANGWHTFNYVDADVKKVSTWFKVDEKNKPAN